MKGGNNIDVEWNAWSRIMLAILASNSASNPFLLPLPTQSSVSSPACFSQYPAPCMTVIVLSCTHADFMWMLKLSSVLFYIVCVSLGGDCNADLEAWVVVAEHVVKACWAPNSGGHKVLPCPTRHSFIQSCNQEFTFGFLVWNVVSSDIWLLSALFVPLPLHLLNLSGINYSVGTLVSGTN